MSFTISITYVLIMSLFVAKFTMLILSLVVAKFYDVNIEPDCGKICHQIILSVKNHIQNFHIITSTTGFTPT